MTKVLIVDDEPAAGNILRILIDRHLAAPHDIVYCQNPVEAIAMVPTFEPDLLMLDIEMPEMNGFDLLNQLGHWNFDVVFTTGYDKYAIKAIRFSAMDYLLKPIDIVELTNALNKHLVQRAKANAGQPELMQNLMQNLQQSNNRQFKLALRTHEGAFFFHPSQIIRLEGVNNYTRFFFTDRKPLLVSRTLKEFEELLSDYDFLRVHKSHLVSRGHVKHIDRDGMLHMEDGSMLPLSRRKKDEISRLFQ